MKPSTWICPECGSENGDVYVCIQKPNCILVCVCGHMWFPDMEERIPVPVRGHSVADYLKKYQLGD